jgi:hypothetical protein
MGHLHLTCTAQPVRRVLLLRRRGPALAAAGDGRRRRLRAVVPSIVLLPLRLDVAIQVASEKQNLESGSSLHRFQGLKPGAFKLRAMNCIQRVQPPRLERCLVDARLHVVVKVEL